MAGIKLSRRERIKQGIRKRLSGSAERPRLSVYRSNKGIYAQIIDDISGKTLVSASSSSKDFSGSGAKIEQSKAVGKLVAEKLKVRPPLVTLATRWILTKRSFNSISLDFTLFILIVDISVSD